MPTITGKNATAETKKLIDNDQVFHVRTRFTIAQVNSGAELLPALPRSKYRIVDMAMIAVGGAVAAVTTVDILSTQAGAAAKLMAAAQANLTQSTLLRAGATGGAILADGASFVANDRNTPIKVGKTGASITTATHIDFLVSYVIEE